MKSLTLESIMERLNELARECGDDPLVWGFVVPRGYVNLVLEQWDRDSRSPLRYRSGQWRVAAFPKYYRPRGVLADVLRRERPPVPTSKLIH